jgi:peptidoglycan/LPS O-acetylase OafA/YrhL
MAAKIIPALDGVRGVAILLVMTYHFTFRFVPVTAFGRAVQGAFTFGWSGVDMFFVLSGFLITRILLETRRKPGYFKHFYMRRVLRIFPLYYGTLFAGFVVAPLFTPAVSPEMQALRDRQAWLWTYSSNIADALSRDWLFNVEWLQLNHLWSLAVEEHFYFVWPLLIGVLSGRTVVKVCVATLACAAALRFGLLAKGLPPVVPYVLTPCRVDALALGGMVAVLVAQPRAHRVLSRLARPAFAGGMIVTLAMAAWQHSTGHIGWRMQVIGFTALAVGFAGVVMIAHDSEEGSFAHRLLTTRALLSAGKYSYGAYVFHQLLQPGFEVIAPPGRFAPLPEGVCLLLHVAVAVTLSFTVAYASFHLFEKHFLSLKRHFGG